MGEQPIFTTKAHVFHIDPKTKRSWVSASSQAVNVSFFFDSSRQLYRIISLEGSKAIINSTVTPNMSFTKTSQKFGQWSDIRANTLYGLGFASESELNKFIEKFQEVKEATRLISSQKANGSSPSGSSSRAASELGDGESCVDSLIPAVNDLAGNLKSSLVAHQRSQSLSGLQGTKGTESPKHQGGGGKDKSPAGSGAQLVSATASSSTTEAQLRYENDRLKLALAQSSANAKKWERELQTLKSNNVRLTSALQESTANVEEWKRQLQALKEDNAKLKARVLELEASHGNPDALGELRKEISNLRNRSESLEAEVRQKDKEIEALRRKVEESQHYSTGAKVEDKLKSLVTDNEGLRSSLSKLQEQLENAKSSQRTKRGALEQLNLRLAQKIQELKDMQLEISALLNS